MKSAEELAAMQVTVTVSDELVREAGARGLPVIDFLETLIDKGFNAVRERPVLNDAMERIRALRSTAIGQAVEGKR
jgi:post-segregation antitoxin (ccd killing protein)